VEPPPDRKLFSSPYRLEIPQIDGLSLLFSPLVVARKVLSALFSFISLRAIVSQVE
jgi:hypothetical protein